MIPFYFSIGGLNVALIDAIVLGALIIAIIVGLVRGFAKQILGILGFFAAVILAYFICEPVAEFLKTTFPKFTEIVTGWITKIPGLSDLAQLTPENAKELLLNSEIPVFLHGLIINLVNESQILNIIPALVDIAIKAITFVGIVIVSLIIFVVFKKLFIWIAKLKFIKPIDKTLGAVFSAIICIVVIVIACVFTSMVAQDFSSSLLTPALADGTTFESVTSKLLGAILKMPFISGLISLGA